MKIRKVNNSEMRKRNMRFQDDTKRSVAFEKMSLSDEAIYSKKKGNHSFLLHSHSILQHLPPTDSADAQKRLFRIKNKKKERKKNSQNYKKILQILFFTYNH